MSRRVERGEALDVGAPAKNTAAIVCGPVFRRELDVCLVVHDHDGWWQFLCGRSDCNDEKDARVVGIGHLTERDPTLQDVLGLQPGRSVARDSKGAPWAEGVKGASG